MIWNYVIYLEQQINFTYIFETHEYKKYDAFSFCFIKEHMLCMSGDDHGFLATREHTYTCMIFVESNVNFWNCMHSNVCTHDKNYNWILLLFNPLGWFRWNRYFIALMVEIIVLCIDIHVPCTSGVTILVIIQLLKAWVITPSDGMEWGPTPQSARWRD